jgi:SNF2 family DNA or RNA helicase
MNLEHFNIKSTILGTTQTSTQIGQSIMDTEKNNNTFDQPLIEDSVYELIMKNIRINDVDTPLNIMYYNYSTGKMIDKTNPIHNKILIDNETNCKTAQENDTPNLMTKSIDYINTKFRKNNYLMLVDATNQTKIKTKRFPSKRTDLSFEYDEETGLIEVNHIEHAIVHKLKKHIAIHGYANEQYDFDVNIVDTPMLVAGIIDRDTMKNIKSFCNKASSNITFMAIKIPDNFVSNSTNDFYFTRIGYLPHANTTFLGKQTTSVYDEITEFDFDRLMKKEQMDYDYSEWIDQYPAISIDEFMETFDNAITKPIKHKIQNKKTYSIGPNEIEVRLNPNGDGLNIKASDPLLIHEINKEIATVESITTNVWHYYKSHPMLTTPIIMDIGFDQAIANLEKYTPDNVTINVPDNVKNWYENLKKEYAREDAPFEMFHYDDDSETWKELYGNGEGIRSKFPELYNQRTKQLVYDLGINWLYDYQIDDTIRLSMKKSAIYAADMGLGKTRVSIALAMLRKCKHMLFVVEPKIVNEIKAECKKLNIDDPKVINKKSDLDEMGFINIIKYTKLWRPLDKNTTKTFSDALKKQIDMVVLDEAHNIKNINTRQSKSVFNLRNIKHKLMCTGTPIPNGPIDVMALLDFGWGSNNIYNPYSAYQLTCPTYDDMLCGIPHQDVAKTGISTDRAFSETFVVSKDIVKNEKCVRIKTPEIKNIRAWEKLISGKLLRRNKEEPEVKSKRKVMKPIIHNHMITPSNDFANYYHEWLLNFEEWIKEQAQYEQDTGNKVSDMSYRSQLMKLRMISTIPQDINNDAENFKWKGGNTKKQEKIKSLVEKALQNNEKVIVYSTTPRLLKHMQTLLEQSGIPGSLFTGKQTIQKRAGLLNEFRNTDNINVLLATISCANTGLNIPEASTVIFADYEWRPSDMTQAYHRILRPGQTKQPHVHFIVMEGTIDEYMHQVYSTKSQAIDRAIDRVNQDESIDIDQWKTYQEMGIEMLKHLGIKVNNV